MIRVRVYYHSMIYYRSTAAADFDKDEYVKII